MNFIWFVCFFPHFFFFWKKLVDRLYLLGKGRIEVGIHLLSPQICCESDKRKKVSPKRCVIICFRWCVLRFFSNCNFNVCSYLFIVLWVFCLFSVSIFFRAFEIIVLLSVFARCSASLICFYFFALTLMVFFVVVVVPFWLSSCIRQHYLNISKLRTSNTLLCSFEHTPKIHCMCTVQCTIPRLINSFAAAKSYSLAHRFNSIRKWQFFFSSSFSTIVWTLIDVHTAVVYNRSKNAIFTFGKNVCRQRIDIRNISVEIHWFKHVLFPCAFSITCKVCVCVFFLPFTDESLTCNVCDRAFHCHRQLASHQQKKRHFG